MPSWLMPASKQMSMLLNDQQGYVANVFVTNASVIFTLWVGETGFRPTQGTAFGGEEVFLLEAEPEVFVVRNSGTVVGRVRVAVGKHDFAHDEESVLCGVESAVEGNRLQDTIGIAAVGLLGGAAVKSPFGAVGKGQIIRVAVQDLGFAAEVSHGGVTIKPEVFEF